MRLSTKFVGQAGVFLIAFGGTIMIFSLLLSDLSMGLGAIVSCICGWILLLMFEELLEGDEE